MNNKLGSYMIKLLIPAIFLLLLVPLNVFAQEESTYHKIKKSNVICIVSGNDSSIGWERKNNWIECFMKGQTPNMLLHGYISMCDHIDKTQYNYCYVLYYNGFDLR